MILDSCRVTSPSGLLTLLGQRVNIPNNCQQETESFFFHHGRMKHTFCQIYELWLANILILMILPELNSTLSIWFRSQHYKVLSVFIAIANFIIFHKRI